MLIVSYLLAGLIVILEILGFITKAYDVSHESLPEKLKHLLYMGSFYLIKVYDLTLAHILPQKYKEDKEFYNKIFIGQEIKKEQLKDRSKTVFIAQIIILFSCLMYIFFNQTGFFDSKGIKKVKRPETGVEAFSLTAEYNDEIIDLDIEIDQKYPSAFEMNQKVENIEKNIEELIRGKNIDLQNVTEDLNLVRNINNEKISIMWSSSDSEIISPAGKVYSDKITSSKQVLLTAIIEYFEVTKEVEIPVKVLPKSEKTSDTVKIQKRLEELMEKTKYDDTFEFPETISGEDITFKLKKENKSDLFLILGLIISGLMIPYGIERKNKLLKERNDQLVIDYTEMISKITLLLEAGNTVRSSFEKTALDYEKRRSSHKKRYVYEEMLRTKNEMALGRAEAECYEDFGRRCGNMYYIRFSSLLSQNLRKGGENLIPQLRKEVSEVLKERQSAIRKKGEETSVKLLIPMAGMFVLVLLIILVPAFLSM